MSHLATQTGWETYAQESDRKQWVRNQYCQAEPSDVADDLLRVQWSFWSFPLLEFFWVTMHWWCYFTGSNDKICRNGLLYSRMLQKKTPLHAFLELKNIFWRSYWTVNTAAVPFGTTQKCTKPLGNWSAIPIPISTFAGDDHGGIHLLDLGDGRSVDCYRWEQGLGWVTAYFCAMF